MAIVPLGCTVSAEGAQNPPPQKSQEVADALEESKSFEQKTADLIERFKQARRRKKE